jgi:hypothetical protein
MRSGPTRTLQAGHTNDLTRQSLTTSFLLFRFDCERWQTLAVLSYNYEQPRCLCHRLCQPQQTEVVSLPSSHSPALSLSSLSANIMPNTTCYMTPTVYVSETLPLQPDPSAKKSGKWGEDTQKRPTKVYIHICTTSRPTQQYIHICTMPSSIQSKAKTHTTVT